MDDYERKLDILQEYYSTALNDLDQWMNELDENRDVILFLTSQEEKINQQTYALLEDHPEDQIIRLLDDIVEGFSYDNYPEWNGPNTYGVARDAIEKLRSLVDTIMDIKSISDAVHGEDNNNEVSSFLLDLAEYFLEELHKFD